MNFGSFRPSVETRIWWIRYLDIPRLQFTILMLLSALALAALGPGRLGGLALLGLAGCVAYNCSIFARFSTLADTQVIAAASCPAGNRLRLLGVNVQMTNRNADDLLAIVRQVKPDVAWFQEVDDWLADRLVPLSADMPNVVKKPLSNYLGVALMSRLRLVDPQIKELTSSKDPSVFTGVELPSGKIIRLYAVHPRPPQLGQSNAERAAQLMATALAARRDNAPHIIVGDLNAVPSEEIIGRIKRVGRLLDPRIGRGLYSPGMRTAGCCAGRSTRSCRDRILRCCPSK
jgi:endonuclease/exonuclease/phosphatase (EEP) superfamily protein YafD